MVRILTLKKTYDITLELKILKMYEDGLRLKIISDFLKVNNPYVNTL